jgi:hypothetical protein
MFRLLTFALQNIDSLGAQVLTGLGRNEIAAPLMWTYFSNVGMCIIDDIMLL